jgi:hypothetical protein
MLLKIATLLSPIAIGTVSAAGLLSRLKLVVSGNAGSTIWANLATELSSRLSGLTHVAAPVGGHAMSLVLHIALAPANTTLSLLATAWRIAFATIADALQLAPIYLGHWISFS